MKTILLALVVTTLLASCGTSNPTVKARAFSVFKDMTGQWQRAVGTEFIEVNPMAQVGDTVRLTGSSWYYVILSKGRVR